MVEEIVVASELKAKRDKKAIPHLEQYAPVWIVDEKLLLEDEAIQFNVVFQHPTHGWISRRYRFDGFNNVLYHKGQNTLREEDVVEITEQEPYINRTVADIPNAYGG
ncbi:MAG: hypothetical protein NZ750_01640 [Anaerolineae bacterium]|nr:hypothetical protein [Anaerolineae bacterium]MDW8173287.1 hypothetical protein [Anaerolineae bacterium]